MAMSPGSGQGLLSAQRGAGGQQVWRMKSAGAARWCLAGCQKRSHGHDAQPRRGAVTCIPPAGKHGLDSWAARGLRTEHATLCLVHARGAGPGRTFEREPRGGSELLQQRVRLPCQLCDGVQLGPPPAPVLRQHAVPHALQAALPVLCQPGAAGRGHERCRWGTSRRPWGHGAIT